MTEVVSTNTPWTLDDLLAAFDRAWSSASLGLAAPETLAVLAAQATAECGRLGKHCYCHNVSNIMGASPEGLYHVLRKAPECAPPDKLPAGAVRVQTSIVCPPGQVAYLPAGGSRFRAYSSLDLGVADKLAVLLRVWPRAVAALAHGGEVGERASNFVQALLKPAYFTADPVAYLNAVRPIAREYMTAATALVSSRPSTLPPPSDAVMPTLLAHAPVEGVVLADFLGTLADDDAPKS